MRKLTISYAKLRESMYQWHGGQNSPLYAAASSGLVDDMTALQAEILNNADWSEGKPCRCNFPNEKPSIADRMEAAKLRRYAAALPLLLSLPFTASDGRVYRALPWAKEKPVFVPVVIRRDRETKECGLFFYEGEGTRRELTCYFHEGQHSQAMHVYMRLCRAVATSDPDAVALVREWNELGPVGTYARIVQRLTRA